MGRTSVILLSCLSALVVFMVVQAAVIPNSCPQEVGNSNCACPQTCKDLRPNCDETCQKRCVCQDGTMDDGSGKCVKKEECCTGNTTYSDCGNDCGNVCQMPFRIGIRCPETQYPGCFCKPGYTHINPGGICVLPEDCPKYNWDPIQ